MTKADFTLKMPKKGYLSVLQVTDTQIIDSSQRRYPDRICQEEIDKWQPDKVYDRMTYYLDGAVKATSPDLIVHTGDLTYGEFDDSGRMINEHIAIMDGYKVPWAFAFGNHERDTAIGEDEYLRRIAAAKYSLFAYKTEFNGKKLEGSANYSFLITDENDKPISVFFIVDTGCFNEQFPGGVYETQRAWMKDVANTYNVSSLLFLHVPMTRFNQIADKLCPQPFTPRELTGDEGFGYIGSDPIHAEYYFDKDDSFFNLCKEIGVKGIFAGHIHANSYSVVSDGIRLTYGLKTGEYDSHFKDKLGGTAIKLLKNGEFTVEHVYIGKDKCK